MTNYQRLEWPEYVPLLTVRDIPYVAMLGGQFFVVDLCDRVFGRGTPASNIVFHIINSSNWQWPNREPSKWVDAWNSAISLLGVYETPDKAVRCDLKEEWPELWAWLQ